jgi:hypothetical protein
MPTLGSYGPGGVAQLPDATRSAQVPRPHTRLPLSLSLASPHLPRDCAWSPLVVVARACSGDATQHLQTHVTTMPKSSAIPGYLTGLFTTGSKSIPRPGVFKGGEEKGCFGRGARLSSTFYVLLYVLSQGHRTRSCKPMKVFDEDQRCWTGCFRKPPLWADASCMYIIVSTG